MPTYRFKAKDFRGKTHSGVLEAADPRALAAALRHRQQFLLEAREVNADERAAALRGVRVRRRQLILFCRHLGVTLDAGIPVLQALDALIEDLEDRAFAAVVEEVRDRLKGGSMLSEALARHPKVFPPLLVALVHAGETGGNLVEVLNGLADYLTWVETLRSRVIQAAIYPAIVFTVLFTVTLFLFTSVLPRILETLVGFGVELPVTTRFLLAVTGVLQVTWRWIVAALLLVLIAPLILRLFPLGRRLLDWIKLNIPVFGMLNRKVALSRFANQLGLLYRSGVNLLVALEVSAQVVGNVVIADAILRARNRIQRGESLSDALQHEATFPALVLRMIGLGERTGRLDYTLSKVKAFYDEEVPSTIQRIFSVVEPLLIVVMGLILFVVALGIYVPIYSAIGAIGRR